MLRDSQLRPTYFQDEPAHWFMRRWAYMLGYVTFQKFLNQCGTRLVDVRRGHFNTGLTQLADLPDNAFDIGASSCCS